MADLKTLANALDQYVKPYCHPIAVRLLEKDELFPEKAKVPSRDFGHPLIMCQGWNMARRYGWTVAFRPEDMACPIATIVMGFKEAPAFFMEGNLATGMYTEDAEAACRSEAELPKLPTDAYQGVVFSPVSRADFEPHLVVFYGNSAQVMRLVQASLYRRGGRMTSSCSGRADCAELYTEAFLSGECQVVLPCNGDRVFGMTQDHEMAFSMPAARIPEIVEGLEGTHKGGVRYPIPSFLTYKAVVPPRYEKLAKMLAGDGEG